MKKYILSTLVAVPVLLMVALFLGGCKKFDKGFLSPTIKYAVNEFSVIRGRYSQSYSMVLDGSSLPVKVRWVHIYDANNNIVDSIFTKKYPVAAWTAAFEPSTDKTFAQIMAKRADIMTEPITINESNGSVTANAASFFLPLGVYTMDIEVSNVEGVQVFPKMLSINIKDGKTFETVPETGAYSLASLLANTPTGGPTHFNGQNNPFVVETITRYADTPNIVIVKVQDKNGVNLNPKNNEIMKRPNTGLNPNPAFLQNLQDYAPDTFTPTDTAMVLRYPVVPFPITSLGNGFNMYYRIPTQYITVDSTSGWSSNSAGNYYKGTADSHFRGYYVDGKFDYSIRIPMRIQYHGAYILNIKLLNVKRK